MRSDAHLRASDEDRYPVAERLRGAAGEGRLTADELDARLAGFWRRFAAVLIDGIIVSLITAILSASLHGALGGALGSLVSVAYFVSFEGSSRGGGAGKQAMRIRVADARTLEPIGYGRAFIRWISAILSAVVFLLGYFWMLWDSENQCWHDKFAGDVVISTDGRTRLEAGR